jgi:hypothetical protein
MPRTLRQANSLKAQVGETDEPELMVVSSPSLRGIENWQRFANCDSYVTIYAPGNGSAFRLRNLLADCRLRDITTCNTVRKLTAAFQPKIESANQLRTDEIRA